MFVWLNSHRDLGRGSERREISGFDERLPTRRAWVGKGWMVGQLYLAYAPKIDCSIYSEAWQRQPTPQSQSCGWRCLINSRENTTRVVRHQHHQRRRRRRRCFVRYTYLYLYPAHWLDRFIIHRGDKSANDSPSFYNSEVFLFVLQKAKSDNHSVILINVEPNMAGKYRCEVSTDGPDFLTKIQSGYMHVVSEYIFFCKS